MIEQLEEVLSAAGIEKKLIKSVVDEMSKKPEGSKSSEVIEPEIDCASMYPLFD